MSSGYSPSDDGFKKYIDKVQNNILSKTGKPKKLSVVKVLILRTLWESGASFPRDWVLSQRLNELTEQKYFDRRIRELRNQSGCDIETGFYQGSNAYRLCSDAVSEAFDRTYLTDRQRIKLFEKHDFSCATYGQTFSAENHSGLQADHKIPLIRGGSSDLDNWQPLCVSCNVAKRRSCQGCTVDCKICAWAFPEQFGQTFTVQLRSEIGSRLQDIARSRSATPHSIIVEAIQQLIDNELSNSQL